MFVTLPKVFDAMVGIATCILVGYFVKTKYVIDEVNENGENFKSKKLYDMMSGSKGDLFSTLKI